MFHAKVIVPVPCQVPGQALMSGGVVIQTACKVVYFESGLSKEIKLQYSDFLLKKQKWLEVPTWNRNQCNCIVIGIVNQY